MNNAEPAWRYRGLLGPLGSGDLLLILEVNVRHHPVGPLHHPPVPDAGGREGGVDAGCAWALVAVGQETEIIIEFYEM